MSDQHRGHQIFEASGVWFYADNNIPVSNDKDRACGHCGKDNSSEGHDGCLGTIPGAINACCGHGDTPTAYVQFADGTDLRGQDALYYAKAQPQ